MGVSIDDHDIDNQMDKQMDELALTTLSQSKLSTISKSSVHAGILLLASAGVATQTHAGEEYIAVQAIGYEESDDRIEVDYTTVSLLKDFGVNVTVSANYSEDEISGATPVWTDESSGASPKLAVDATTGMISSVPHASLSDFEYMKAEMEDKRTAGDIGVTWRTPVSRDEITVGISQSEEEDYESVGMSANYLHYLDNSKNRSISGGISVLNNDVLYPRTGKWEDAKFYTGEVGFTQILSPTAVVNVAGYAMYEDGALTNPYQTVIRSVNIGTPTATKHGLFLAPEKRPDTRKVAGLKVSGVSRLEQDVLDHPITVNGSYRLYSDDWGQTAHTLSSQVYIGELDDKGQLMLGARVSHQSEADFYKAHDDDDKIFNATDYATSDERMGDMTSVSVQAGYEWRFNHHWHLLSQVAYEHQSTGLDFVWAGGGLRYDF